MALQFLNSGYFAGSVGIGVENPSKKLEVVGNAEVVGTLYIEAANNQIRLLDTNDSTVNFSVGANGTFQIRDVNAATTPFSIQKGAASNSLYIDEDGLVGIGANDPTHKLVVNSGATNVTSVFKSTDNQTWISIQDDDSGTYGALIGIDSDESENFVVANSSAAKMLSLNSSGSLKLHNYDSTNQVGTPTYLLGTDASGNVLKVLDGGGTVTGSGTATQVAFWDTSTSLSGNSNLYWDSTNNHLGIGDSTPGSRLKVASGASETSIYTVDINHIRNDANVATHAMRLNVDLSGADNTTADRTNSGLFIDIDSSANGDTSNEHRIYGVNSNINFTGFTDLARGGYFLAESNYTGAKTAQLVGVYGHAIHDVDDAAGGVSNMYGVYGNSSIQDTGDVDNAFGVYGQVSIGDTRVADVGITKGVEGEILIDKSTALNYGTMIGISSVIDNNEGSTPNFGAQYLFKGDYQGDKGPTAWGIYTEGTKHYFSNTVGIGTTTPDSPLEVQFTEAIGSAKRMFHIDYNSTDNYGSAIFKMSSGSSSSNSFKIEQVTGGGNGEFGTYLDTNIQNANIASGAHGNINFVTGADTSGRSIVMTIGGGTQKGNVGINVTDPSYKLDVNGQARIQSTNYEMLYLHQADANGGFIKFTNTDDTDGWYTGIAGTEKFIISRTADNTSPFITVEQNGKVGIGVDSPLRSLSVFSASIVSSEFKGSNAGHLVDISNSNESPTYNGIRFQHNNTFKMGVTHIADGTTKGYVQIGNGYAAGDEILVVDGRTSNVGIGTTSPTSLLEISQQLSAASTIDYPYTISSRDDGNIINQAGGEGVGIKFRIAGNAATTPGDSLVGASIAAIRESSSDTDSSTGLGFFVTQNDETLDEALRLTHDLAAEFASSVQATQIIISSAVPSVLFDETDVTANWRNRVQSGGYRIQYASDGTTFADYISLGANAFTLAKDTTFTEQAFSAATSSGDGSSTLTTKGYVDSLITGATIYRGTWQAGISATSTGTTTASTTLTVSAAILDAAGNTPTLVGAVVTGAGITGTVKVASVTSSTVYELDTAIDATATAYIFSPIYGAPDLSGVTQTSGYYYICSEAGSATPNGAGTEPNTWGVGDWVIWNDDVGASGEWQKVDNSSVLSGVGTGQTVALWEGLNSVTDSDTLGNAPITVSGNNTTFAGTGTFAGNVTLTKAVGDTELLIDADTNNNNENYNPRLHLRQDGGAVSAYFGLNGDADNTFTGAIANGAYIKAVGSIQFANGSGTDLAMTIDTSQNVGIGISGPGAKLHIASANLGGTDNDTTTQAIFQAINSNTSKLYIQDYRTIDGTDWTSSGKRIQEKIDSTWMGYMQFNGDVNNGGISFGTGQNTTQGDIVERMRITDGGTIGINKTNPSAIYQVDMKRDMTDPDTAGYAMRIDTNISGTKSAATDITQGALFLDTDSSAIGTTTDEHRIVGINNDVRYSGLPDAVYGTQTRVESNSTQTGQCTYLAAAYNIAQSDGGTNHTVGSLIGTWNNVGVQDNSIVSNTYGTRNLISVAANRERNTGTIYGSFNEIDLDSTNNINYGAIYGTRIIIDNNQATAAELGNTFLFKGEYNGVTTDDDCWGLYVAGDKHYLSSRLFLGTTNPDDDSIMQVMGTDAERYVRFKTSNDESRFDFYIGGTGNASRLSMFDSDGTTEGVRLSSSGNSYFLNNLGIGMTNPSSKLTIDAPVGNFANGTNAISLNYDGGSSPGDVGGGIVFSQKWWSASTGQQVTGGIFGIKHAGNGSYGGGLGFYTQPNGASDMAQHMVIRSTGEVGIGTSSPGTALQVGGLDDGSNYDITLGWNAVSSQAVGTKRSALTFKTSQTGVNNEDIYKWDIAMVTAPATASNEPFGSNLAFLRSTRSSTSVDETTMILTQLGDVGVGTSSPKSKLQVAGGIQMADDTDTASADKVGTMRYRTATNEPVPVTGTDLVTNGDLAVSTGWNLQNSASINNTTGVATVPGAGSLTSTGGNWSLYQSNVMDPNKTYMLRFQARRDAGPNANMYAGWAYTNQFNQTVTADWVQYEVVFTTTSQTWDELTFGGVTGTTFEVKDITVVEVTEEDASYADMCMQTGASTYEWVNIVRNTY